APKMRSDGARTTGAAITIVTRRAAAEAASASAAWRRNVHHRGNDQSRSEERPGANITHQRSEASGREERHAAGDGDLYHRKQRGSAQEPRPPARDERRDPEREEQA